MRVELDLALGAVTASNLKRLKEELPVDFSVEDRTPQGWGTTIIASGPLPEDVSTAIDSFLKSLSGFHALIKKERGVLRVGVFHHTYTCTVTIESTKQLAALNLSLEISTYPTSEDK